MVTNDEIRSAANAISMGVAPQVVGAPRADETPEDAYLRAMAGVVYDKFQAEDEAAAETASEAVE